MSFESQLELALALVAQGKNEEALHVFEGIQLDDLRPHEQFVVGLNKKKCLELLGRFDEAEAQLESLQRLDCSDQFKLFLESGRIDLLFARGKYREFVERGRSLLRGHSQELNQKEYENVLYGIRLNVPLALISLGRFEDGIAALKGFLPQVREEDEPRAHLFLAVAYLQVGNRDAAIAELEQVLRLDRTGEAAAQAHYRLGALLLDAGSPATAKRHFKAAEELKHALPGVPRRDLYIFLANTCAQLGQEDEHNRYLQLANSI